MSGSISNASSPGSCRIVVVGVGGATCSGKTTLAKHLVRILDSNSVSPADKPTSEARSGKGIHDTFILHQDDFAPAEATLPVDDKFGVSDWDHPPTAIEYEKMHQTIEYIKANGSFPPDFSSHDHLNSQPDCPISESIFSKWASRFASLSTWLPADGVRLMLADGFLLYYDPAVRSSMEVKIFLRTPKEVLKQRREQRPGYATAEGTVWKDPEGYFDNIVWPAYELAHKDVFTNQDVETGDVVIPAPGEESRRGGPVDKLIVLDAKNPNDTTQAGPKQKNTANGEPTQFSHEMTALVDEACKAIWEYLTSEFGIPEA